ncbi:MAG: hypothetical protein H7836_16305 [Magnetococcus sp. YQC-3]
MALLGRIGSGSTGESGWVHWVWTRRQGEKRAAFAPCRGVCAGWRVGGVVLRVVGGAQVLADPWRCNLAGSGHQDDQTLSTAALSVTAQEAL